jgi:lipopolysaccharide transport system permease protein
VNIGTPFERAWHFRDLIRAILTRELASRFRGSMLGWMWAIAAPLIMMAAYTVIFSGIVTLAGSPGNRSIGARSLLIFSGITIFNLFAELLYRAPGLLHEHAGVIKKSIFPSETLAWIAVLRALVYAAISFAVLVAFQLVLTRHIPWTVILVPLLSFPLVMFLLGAVWFLMALGAFTRDVVHLMATIVPLFMFVTPVFYGFADMPARIRPWERLNIVGDYIDLFRDIVLYGKIDSPGLAVYGMCFAASYVVFLLGYMFFIQYKSVMVDVI